jgi:hypothetical protein
MLQCMSPLLAYRIIRRDAIFCLLSDKSEHAKRVLANLKI